MCCFDNIMLKDRCYLKIHFKEKLRPPGKEKYLKIKKYFIIKIQLLEFCSIK